MKLDRNITNPKRGKYALIKLRLIDNDAPMERHHALQRMESFGLVDFGDTEDSDFFVIRLKDKYAAPALIAYASAAFKDDPEYANDVLELARIASKHPNKRKPD